MGFTKIMAVLLFILAASGSSMAAEKQVDWPVGKDYKDWASDNKFQVGDTLVFQYNAQYHNVLQVNKKDFESCSITSPMASYSSGSDSVPLTTPGPYYFLCGYPGHCEAGQKLKIKVDKCDKNGGHTIPNSPGQTYPYTPQVGPRQSSSAVSTANWLTAFKAFAAIVAASYICGLAI